MSVDLTAYYVDRLYAGSEFGLYLLETSVPGVNLKKRRQVEQKLVTVTKLLPCSGGKESTGNAGHLGLIPGSGRSPRKGTGNPLQYSCLENSMDRAAWRATLHGVAKSQAPLTDKHTHTRAHTHTRTHARTHTQ